MKSAPLRILSIISLVAGTLVASLFTGAAPATAESTWVSGNVAWGDPAPESVTVQAWDAERGWASHSVVTAGEYVIRDLIPTRSYALRVTVDWGAVSTTSFVTGDPADPLSSRPEEALWFRQADTDAIDIDIEPTTSLSGLVLRDDGTPATDARVIAYVITDYLEGRAQLDDFTVWKSTDVNAAGEYTISGLEYLGDEIVGYALHVWIPDERSGWVGTEPEQGLVPEMSSAIFPPSEQPSIIPPITVHVPHLPADQIILAPALEYDWAGSTGQILAVGDGVLSAFRYSKGTLDGGYGVRGAMGGQQIFGPGNWGPLDYEQHSTGYSRVPYNDVLTVDQRGYMFLYEGDNMGNLHPATRIGNGWAGYRVIPAGDLTGDRKGDLLAIDTAGNLKLYRGDGKGGFLYPYPKVGNGWKGFDLYAAGDITRDGKVDILSVDASGRLWMYAGRGDGTFQQRKQVGSGWNRYTLAAGADIDGDRWGTSDIVGRNDATGELYLYSGLGAGRFATKKLIATGW